MSLEQPVARGFIQAKQLSVADCLDCRRTQATIEKSHLPDYFAGWNPGYSCITPAAASNGDSETSRRNDVKRVGDFILLKQRLAAPKGYAFQLSFKCRKRGGIEHAEQGNERYAAPGLCRFDFRVAQAKFGLT